MSETIIRRVVLHLPAMSTETAQRVARETGERIAHAASNGADLPSEVQVSTRDGGQTDRIIRAVGERFSDGRRSGFYGGSR